MNTNQIGRELVKRLVETTGCDLKVAIRFFYSSAFYSTLEEHIADSPDELFYQILTEYTQAS